MHSKNYDVIIFGATSFVGQLLTHYIDEQYGLDFRWAIAGRSRNKLENLKLQLSDHQQEKLDIIIVDASDDQGLTDMCQQTKAIVSTVGPYALYGEPLIRACVNTGTDYCDLTGEPQWIHKMLNKYEQQAEQSGARIVNSCGFDSVPSDIGVKYLQNLIKERKNEPSKHIKMRVKAAKGGLSGGTFASIVNIAKEVVKNPSIRPVLSNPYSLCTTQTPEQQRQPDQKGVSYDKRTTAWTVPFIMSSINTKIVHRSNSKLNFQYGEQFLYEETMLTGKGIKGLLLSTSMVAGIMTLMVSAAIKPTRWLLEKYILPKPGEGPSPDEQTAGYYDLRFTTEDSKGTATTIKFCGNKDPGYGSTARILGEAVVSLARDLHAENGDKTGQTGGFWTPASIFDDRFIRRLKQNAEITIEECQTY